MGFNKRKGLKDVVEFEGLDGEWIIAKVEYNDARNNSKIIVRPGQAALIVHNGKIEKILKPGTLILDTEHSNLGIVRKLTQWAWGGGNAYPYEVYFINTRIKLDFLWGTASPIDFIDSKAKIPMKLRARGQLGIQINDYQYLIENLVGSISSGILSYDTLHDYVKGMINQKLRKVLATYISKNKVSYYEISAEIDDISGAILDGLQPEFKKIGLELMRFDIEDINCPDEYLNKYKSIMEKKAEYGELNYDYRTERGYDVYEGAASKGGTPATIMGIGLGMDMTNKMSAGVGKGLIPDAGSNGSAQETIICPTCKARLVAGQKFCPECGSKIVYSCPKCGTAVKPGIKFCPECGANLYAPAKGKKGKKK